MACGVSYKGKYVDMYVLIILLSISIRVSLKRREQLTKGERRWRQKPPSKLFQSFIPYLSIYLFIYLFIYLLSYDQFHLL